MGEEFYAAIKLVTGEEIFSIVSSDDNDGDPVIILQNPVIMKSFTNHSGTYLKVKPWMEIPDDDLYVIKLDKVVTMTEIKNQSTIDFYLRYLGNDNVEVDGKVSISDKMGYLGSVENSRKFLEDIFLKNIKDLKDNKES